MFIFNILKFHLLCTEGSLLASTVHTKKMNIQCIKNEILVYLKWTLCQSTLQGKPGLWYNDWWWVEGIYHYGSWRSHGGSWGLRWRGGFWRVAHGLNTCPQNHQAMNVWSLGAIHQRNGALLSWADDGVPLMSLASCDAYCLYSCHHCLLLSLHGTVVELQKHK